MLANLWHKMTHVTVEVTAYPLPPKPKHFSIPVGSGYVDDAGKWHATKSEAEYASARRHLILAIMDCVKSDAITAKPFFALWEFGDQWGSPDTIRAMAILGQGEP